MFSSLRQRATSPVPPATQETPRAIPSIKLTTATPLTCSIPLSASLSPRGNANTRSVVPKRVLVLHEAPPPLPVPKSKPLEGKDIRDTLQSHLSSQPNGRFDSGAGKLKVFLDRSSDVDATPKFAQKKKSRAALDSIKWALGDRTNVKEAVSKIEKITTSKESEPRSSVDSDRERWKWTLGRNRKEGKNKVYKRPQPEAQPGSVRLHGNLPPISSAGDSNRAASPAPSAALSNSSAQDNDDTASRSDSIAVRAIRSVRSVARIGTWGRSDSPATLMNKRLANNSMRTASPTYGSGESWLVGRASLSSSLARNDTPDSSFRVDSEGARASDTFKASGTGRYSSVSRRTPKSSTSTTSSENSSIMPRESTSTRRSLQSESRTSASTRRSSGVTSNSFWVPSSIPEGDYSSTSHDTRRDSNASDRLKRGALANIFDISTAPEPRSSRSSLSSNNFLNREESSDEPQIGESRSFEGHGRSVQFETIRSQLSTLQKMAVTIPEVSLERISTSDSGKTESAMEPTSAFAVIPLPQKAGGHGPFVTSSVDSTPARPQPNAVTPMLLSLPVEDGSIPYEEHTGLTMVNAATDELHDLIYHLNVTSTPGASPARFWTGSALSTPGSEDRERDIHPCLPDTPLSIQRASPAAVDRSFASDRTLSRASQTSTVKHGFMAGNASNGSVVNLRKGAGPFTDSTVRTESSITSLRPYRLAKHRVDSSHLPFIHLSPSSAPSSSPEGRTPQSSSPDGSPSRPRAESPQRLGNLLDLLSEESVYFRRADDLPQPRESATYSISSSTQLDEEPSYVTSISNESRDSDSGDEESSSDIPDELQKVIDQRPRSNMTASTSSLEDSLFFPQDIQVTSAYDLPSLEASSAYSKPLHSRTYAPARNFHPFSITVTAPSIDSRESEAGEFDDVETDRHRQTEEDDTGKKSFDFTGEINRLNEGGARLSFVEQLAVAFQEQRVECPSPTSHEDANERFACVPDAGIRSTFHSVERATTEPQPGAYLSDGTIPALSSRRAHHSRTNTSSSSLSEHELSLLKDLDASMYALATLNLVHPTSETTLRESDRKLIETLASESDPPSDVSLSQDIDSSAFKIANLDLSLIFPSGNPREDQSSTNLIDLGGPDSSSINATSLELESHQFCAPQTQSERDASQARPQSEPEVIGHSRNESVQSVSSFGSIVYGGVSDPFGYKYSDDTSPPSNDVAETSLKGHAPNESVTSIPSISSYGRIIKGGRRNPFGYTTSIFSGHNRNMSQISEFEYPLSGIMDDINRQNTSGSIPPQPRTRKKSTDSDRSAFYFRGREPPPPLPLPPLPYRNHTYEDSISSIAPPVSLRNTSYKRHNRNRSSHASNDSGSSVAHAYSALGANGGRAMWAQHTSDHSIDSSGSEMPSFVPGRPGLGDKMFSSAANYRSGAPLTSILASPSVSEAEGSDHDLSLPSRPQGAHSSSTHSGPSLKPRDVSDTQSIFDADSLNPVAFGAMLFGEDVGNYRRPVSVFSSASVSSSAVERDDDTMVSMLGGGHISRRALVENSSSPSRFRIKPKARKTPRVKGHDQVSPPLNASDLVGSLEPNPSPSWLYGGPSQTLLQPSNPEQRSSSDDMRLATIRGTSQISRRNIFSESSSPSPTRQTSIIVTPAGPDTPPTSDCESNGSQSSIDFTRLDPLGGSRGLSVISPRIRARGSGHRRRSAGPDSILAELPGLISAESDSSGSISSIASSIPSVRFELVNAPDGREFPIEIVDSSNDITDDIMRRYAQIRKEALEVVKQSKMEWADTDFSRFAVSAFVPPHDSISLQAFYEHSVKTYTHLPPELVIRRVRTTSRPSPYRRTPRKAGPRLPKAHSRTESMEQALSWMSPPALVAIPPNSPFAIDHSFSAFGNLGGINTSESSKGVTVSGVRPRVTSKARRTALGWSKQKNLPTEFAPKAAASKPSPGSPIMFTSARGKENAIEEGLGMLGSPNQSLRISRPRPRARPQSMLANRTR